MVPSEEPTITSRNGSHSLKELIFDAPDEPSLDVTLFSFRGTFACQEWTVLRVAFHRISAFVLLPSGTYPLRRNRYLCLLLPKVRQDRKRIALRCSRLHDRTIELEFSTLESTRLDPVTFPIATVIAMEMRCEGRPTGIKPDAIQNSNAFRLVTGPRQDPQSTLTKVTRGRCLYLLLLGANARNTRYPTFGWRISTTCGPPIGPQKQLIG